MRQTRKVEVNGTELHYIERGEGEPVLFVHGGMSDLRTWGPQMEPFGEYYRAISYSRRAYYPNPFPADYTTSDMMTHVEDLYGFIQALDLGQVRIVANSYGAYISLWLAIKYPRVVRAMALAEPPVQPLLMKLPGGAEMLEEFRERAWRPAGRAFASGDMEGGVRAFIEGAVGWDEYEKLPPRVRAAMMPNAPEMKVGTETSFEEHMPDLTCEDASRITAPTLLMRGANSPRMYTLINNELARCMPYVEQVIVPNASHILHNHNPAVHNKFVLEWFELVC